MNPFVAICIISILVCSNANAQTIGDVVVPNQQLQLRMSPPTASGTLPGEKNSGKKTADTGDAFVILGGKKLPTWFDKDVWVQVAPVETNGVIRKNEPSWIYWGPESKNNSVNFESGQIGNILGGDSAAMNNFKKQLYELRSEY